MGKSKIKSTKKRLRFIAAGGIFIIVVVAVLPGSWLRYAYNTTIGRFFRYSVADRMKEIREPALKRLSLKENPVALRLVALKEEKVLEMYAKFNPDAGWKLLASYPVLAASGTAGPKLKEGDCQVPEGIYKIEYVHPNSHFYLALKVGYPGEEDIAMARAEGRDTTNLGSDIMIHGKGGSIGCIAVENDAIEEIFVLAVLVTSRNIELLIAPYDFRIKPLPENYDGMPAWLPERYRKLQARMLEGYRGESR